MINHRGRRTRIEVISPPGQEHPPGARIPMSSISTFDLDTVVANATATTGAAAPTADTDVSLASYLRQHQEDLDSLPTYRPVIGAIIPAYNEAETIEAVIRSLLKQTRLPDQIHVIVNNTKDDTFELAAKFAGPRTGKKIRKGSKERQTTEVFVHDIGANPD